MSFWESTGFALLAKAMAPFDIRWPDDKIDQSACGDQTEGMDVAVDLLARPAASQPGSSFLAEVRLEREQATCSEDREIRKITPASSAWLFWRKPPFRF